MKAIQKKPTDELRMSSKDFDRIMGQVLQAKPKAKKPAKAKSSAQKRPEAK